MEQTLAHMPPSELRWAAFFGDVEHEASLLSQSHQSLPPRQ
jgi:hypothetical protein